MSHLFNFLFRLKSISFTAYETFEELRRHDLIVAFEVELLSCPQSTKSESNHHFATYPSKFILRSSPSSSRTAQFSPELAKEHSIIVKEFVIEICKGKISHSCPCFNATINEQEQSCKINMLRIRVWKEENEDVVLFAENSVNLNYFAVEGFRTEYIPLFEPIVVQSDASQQFKSLATICLEVETLELNVSFKQMAITRALEQQTSNYRPLSTLRGITRSQSDIGLLRLHHENEQQEEKSKRSNNRSVYELIAGYTERMPKIDVKNDPLFME